MTYPAGWLSYFGEGWLWQHSEPPPDTCWRGGASVRTPAGWSSGGPGPRTVSGHLRRGGWWAAGMWNTETEWLSYKLTTGATVCGWKLIGCLWVFVLYCHLCLLPFSYVEAYGRARLSCRLCWWAATDHTGMSVYNSCSLMLKIWVHWMEWVQQEYKDTMTHAETVTQWF